MAAINDIQVYVGSIVMSCRVYDATMVWFCFIAAFLLNTLTLWIKVWILAPQSWKWMQLRNTLRIIGTCVFIVMHIVHQALLKQGDFTTKTQSNWSASIWNCQYFLCSLSTSAIQSPRPVSCGLKHGTERRRSFYNPLSSHMKPPFCSRFGTSSSKLIMDVYSTFHGGMQPMPMPPQVIAIFDGDSNHPQCAKGLRIGSIEGAVCA